MYCMVIAVRSSQLMLNIAGRRHRRNRVIGGLLKVVGAGNRWNKNRSITIR